MKVLCYENLLGTDIQGHLLSFNYSNYEPEGEMNMHGVGNLS